MTDKKIDFGVQFDVIDEITEPAGMKSRSMSGEWITTQRYKDVREMWNRSKQTAQSILDNRKKSKGKKNA